MNLPRASGILLHPTSLPGRFGIGDMGDQAFEFVDLLVRMGQTYWQILPLTPTGYGDSPYSSISAFAGNTLLISPERLARDGLVAPDVVTRSPEFPAERVDYGMVYEWKTGLLAASFETFCQAQGPLGDEFESFCREQAWWLDDYALFCALKRDRGHSPWYDWPDDLKFRDQAALDAARSQLARSIRYEKFTQFFFFRQWLELRWYCGKQGIRIIGDVPIFVALDSVDVWCNRDNFKLSEDGSPQVVSGVPPDYFSATGQLWGNPIYDWDAMQRDGFGWWVARMRFALYAVDIVRIDHFIGFARVWEVPAGDKTAENGTWVDVPGERVLAALDKAFGGLPFIAEDLGAVTAEVEALRDSFGLPGMRILQYGFGGDPRELHLPHNYVRNCVAYTGTHDNDTAVGWFRSAPKNERALARKYLSSNGREIHWDMARSLLSSVADTCVLPMQDVLGLGREARMNTPASGSQNWNWRLLGGQVTDTDTRKLHDLTFIYGRLRSD